MAPWYGRTEKALGIENVCIYFTCGKLPGDWNAAMIGKTFEIIYLDSLGKRKLSAQIFSAYDPSDSVKPLEVKQ